MQLPRFTTTRLMVWRSYMSSKACDMTVLHFKQGPSCVNPALVTSQESVVAYLRNFVGGHLAIRCISGHWMSSGQSIWSCAPWLTAVALANCFWARRAACIWAEHSTPIHPTCKQTMPDRFMPCTCNLKHPCWFRTPLLQCMQARSGHWILTMALRQPRLAQPIWPCSPLTASLMLWLPWRN